MKIGSALVRLSGPDEVIPPEKIKSKLKSLYPYRKDRTLKYKLPQDIELSVRAGHVIDKLAKEAGLLPETIASDKNGAPVIEGGYLSLSHSGLCCLCAVSKEQRVGCDIQKHVGYNKEIAKRFFTKEETEYIASFSDPEKEFYRIWARKESLGKCVGSGVTATLEINVLEDTAFLKGAEYSLYDLEAPEGYSAALALKKG